MQSEKALHWIVNFMEEYQVPYLICGGLAARAYGASRPLHDIDLYVPAVKYQSVVKYGYPYISHGPTRVINDHWDIEYVQFDYLGQKIEVGSSENIKIFDAMIRAWHQENIDFTQYEQLTVLGKVVRVMKREALISYKQKLNRDVDVTDIKQMLKKIKTD